MILQPIELLVLELICQDKCLKEIASGLRISYTYALVLTHRMRRKMGVATVAGMVVYAIKHGLVRV